MALAVGCGGGTPQNGSAVVGAGSTLVAPLVARWATAEDVPVAYAAVGSGAGIAQATAHTVDFGASDAPLSPDQRAAAKDLVQIPWALAATVIAVNVPGVRARLRLTGAVAADIYLGSLTSWDDPLIRALNPGVPPPRLRIAPNHRSDASGDTFALSDYLSHESPRWRAVVGTSTDVSWRVGTSARGNAGVIAAVKQTKGAIAYAAVAQVKSSGVSYALLRNAAGRYPAPSPAAITAAAQHARFGADHTTSIVSPPASAAAAYPLATFTYALVRTSSPKLALLKRFLRYAVGRGQRYAAQLSLAPLPAGVRRADLAFIATLRRP